MFFRFGAAVVLIVAVSLLGIAVEKRTLSLTRAIALQHYRADQLQEQRIRLRLKCEELGAPARLMESIEAGELHVDLVSRPMSKSASH